MKFLIIMRRVPAGTNVKYGATPEKIRGYAESLKSGLDKGKVEFAAALLSGGAAYVVDASNAKHLAWAIRDNPLFPHCTVEIEPIVDAHVFLEGAAKAVAKIKKG